MRMSAALSLFVVALSHPGAQAGRLEIPIEATVASQIAPNGDSAQVMLKNNSPEPLLCDSISATVSFVEGEFNQKIGEASPRFRDVFVRAGETLTETIGASELRLLKEQGRNARIYNATAQLGSCRIATLEDYCAHATLSADEKKTIDALNRHYGVRGCEDWHPEYQTTLHLSRKGLTDLTPIAFFRNLRVLSVHQNSVRDLSPLSRLSDLREVHLENNPIESVDAIRALPKLEVACVGSTPFAAKGPVAKPFYSNCRHR